MRTTTEEITDYYPFGMVAGTYSSPEQYRYGFNGKELDTEGVGGDYLTAVGAAHSNLPTNQLVVLSFLANNLLLCGVKHAVKKEKNRQAALEKPKLYLHNKS